MEEVLVYPEGLSPPQHQHWDRARALLDQLHDRGILISALIETVVEDQSWLNRVGTNDTNDLTFDGPRRNDEASSEPTMLLWRLELVLKPPFSLPLFLEMACEFKSVDVFMPELSLRDSECRPVNNGDEIDVLFVFDTPPRAVA